MTKLTPELQNAFRCLGITPDADQSTIRSAWRAMVRSYHPDQVKGDKVEANRRLADLNAAFDLVSMWSPEDARAYARACRHREATQQSTQEAQARQAAADRAASDARQRHAAQQAKVAQQLERRKARRAAEILARKNAAALERKEAARKTVKVQITRQDARQAAAACAKFREALRHLAPRAPKLCSMTA